MSYVFISYSRSERRWAERVDETLQRTGFVTWRDVRDLDPDTDFTGELEAKISAASHFVVCLTPDVVTRKRSFVRREIAYALATEESRRRAAPARRLPIVPIVFPGGELPIHVSTWTKIDVPNEAAFNRAMQALVARLRGDQMADAGKSTGSPAIEQYLNKLHERVTQLLQQRVHTLIDVGAKDASESVAGPLDDFPTSPVVDFAPSEAAARTDGDQATLGSVLAKYSRLLLLGAPGAGKTTGLLALTRGAAAERRLDDLAPLPVLVHLGRWKGERPLTVWLRSQSGVPAQAEGEPKLYLLDGLDEVVDLSGKRTPQNQQRELLDAIDADLGPAPLVISCRVQDYEAIHPRANLDGAVCLQAVAVEEVQRYLHARGLSSLWKAAKRDRQLLDLMRTPLLLAVATVAWREAGATDAVSEAAIFDHFVSGRFSHERARAIPLPYDEGTTRRRLGDRAAGIELLAEEDPSLVDRARAAMDEDFSAFAERMHFLQRGLSGGRQFLHRRLEDFLALPALEELTSQAQGQPVHSWIHFFAERIGAAAVPLLARELNHSQKERRESAVWSLTRIDDPSVIPVLIGAAGSNEKYIRCHAEDAIKRIGSAAVPALQAAFLGEDDELAWTATRRLISIGDAAVPILQELTMHASPRARTNALFALRELRSHESLADVEHRLGDADPEVRATALEALAVVGDGLRISRAARRALDDTSEIVRQSAAFVCGFPDVIASVGDDARADTVKRLIELLNDVPDVSKRAAAALTVLGNPEAAAQLEACLAHGSQEMRRALVMQLARTPFAALAEPLARILLNDRDALVREYAAYSLATIGATISETAARALASAAEHDEERYVRGAAADALKEVRGESPP